MLDWALNTPLSSLLFCLSQVYFHVMVFAYWWLFVHRGCPYFSISFLFWWMLLKFWKSHHGCYFEPRESRFCFEAFFSHDNYFMKRISNPFRGWNYLYLEVHVYRQARQATHNLNWTLKRWCNIQDAIWTPWYFHIL